MPPGPSPSRFELLLDTSSQKYASMSAVKKWGWPPTPAIARSALPPVPCIQPDPTDLPVRTSGLIHSAMIGRVPTAADAAHASCESVSF